MKNALSLYRYSYSKDMRISSGEIAAILKKHGVSGDAEALQNSYRKRLGQRLMSSIRDENGRREVRGRIRVLDQLLSRFRKAG